MSKKKFFWQYKKITNNIKTADKRTSQIKKNQQGTLHFTPVCRIHQRLIQSGVSHVFVVYSEPIELAVTSIFLSISLSN